MTNISASTQQFSMYAQVPEGCLPIKYTQYSTCQTFSLSPYQSTRFEQEFYFPMAGNFRHFPTTITIGEKAVSKAESHILKVIQERQKVSDDATFKEILMSGDPEAVLKYMETTEEIEGINEG